MKKCILIMAGAVCALTMVACSNDGDKNSLNTVYYSLAAADNPDDKAVGFTFTTDSGKEMWVSGSSLPYGPRDGQRILAYYSILYGRPTSDPYDHYVAIRDYVNVLTKDAVLLTDDVPGGDYVTVRNVWVGGGYINFDFTILGFDRTHYINLAFDTEAEYADGKVHLQFLHDRNNDGQSRELRGLVSFDPRGVLPANTGEKTDVVIHWKTPMGEKTATVTYSADALDNTEIEGPGADRAAIE